MRPYDWEPERVQQNPNDPQPFTTVGAWEFIADLLDDMTLRARADQESSHRHENDEPGSQGEDRVVGKGGAQPLGSVLIPIAERGLEQ